MITQSIEIKTQDGVCDAYIAVPSGKGPFPAVLFYMDAYGVRPYLEQMAQRLAQEGYFVLMPNLFYRIRRAPVLEGVEFPLNAQDMPKAREKLMPLFGKYKPAEMGVRDAKDYLEYLAHDARVKRGPVGITGYCMGGGLAIRTAAKYPDRVAAVASFHGGRLVTDEPDSPHKQLGQIRAELYVAHADQDQNMNSEQIERFGQALAQSKVKAEAELYSGALHGFTMADLPMHNPGALERHWQKLLELFKRTL